MYIDEDWPSCIAKLFRMYKEAGRIFVKALYEVSSDLFPADIFAEMAQPLTRLWEDDDESHEIWIDVHLPH